MNALEAAKRKKRKRGGMVEGHAPRVRMDRKAKGGSVTKADFNAAINDQPARPTVEEPNALPAVHVRARGGATPDMGWVDGQQKRGGSAKGRC